jgi:hypothetical protein
VSLFKPIADAVRTILATLPNAPTVEVRKNDSMFGRDVPPMVIVTLGDEGVTAAVSGAGTSTDLGDVYKSYQIGITIYRNCLADIDSSIGNNPDFILAAKQALNKVSLAGVPQVRDTTLVDHPEWEGEAFGQGAEVSRFGIVFFAWETRLGN